MTDIVTERSGSILRVQFNRPAKKNAMTFAMYVTMADLFNTTANDDRVRAWDPLESTCRHASLSIL